MDKRSVLETIIKTAIANEEKGYRFYAGMAGKTGDGRIKKIFDRLSMEELNHKEIFEKILNLEMEDAKGEIEEREGRLLISLIKTGVFQGMGECDWETATPVKALALGIQAEKDSILLYQEIYNQTRLPEIKELMSRLLHEEKMHLVELREEMEILVNDK